MLCLQYRDLLPVNVIHISFCRTIKCYCSQFRESVSMYFSPLLFLSWDASLNLKLAIGVSEWPITGFTRNPQGVLQTLQFSQPLSRSSGKPGHRNWEGLSQHVSCIRESRGTTLTVGDMDRILKQRLTALSLSMSTFHKHGYGTNLPEIRNCVAFVLKWRLLHNLAYHLAI